MDIKNFAACFIDLLGQKNTLLGQGLVPEVTDLASYQKFESSVGNSVGHIKNLHDNFELLSKQYRRSTEISNFYTKEQSDAVEKANCVIQRWSDGMVLYTSVDNDHRKLSISAVHEIFMYAGIFCFLGLAQKQPLRGGMEISWGWERNGCEIYGAVVANAYKEEQKAKLGRISVGSICVAYLLDLLQSSPMDLYQDANRRCAKSCLEMLYQENDNFYIDYLGAEFYKKFFSQNKDFWGEQYQLALGFTKEQILQHKASKCLELESRYEKVLEYFELRTANFV
ncbi:hypothetical protein D0C16_19245 [Cellvibrio sp. KY-GH-1]|uniref:hypothetical protein n=1 Tax=Cellvibrio sp. KY-GH-1 TaxID=2303332 RepID=UPI001246E4EE|nr:hypothetical protein [Cellvibrio sp. KY-GH-1]QEY17937.1 hypothetical protein D0C16_19245 [Cellvibrio sp. KY-GH-1]